MNTSRPGYPSLLKICRATREDVAGLQIRHSDGGNLIEAWTKDGRARAGQVMLSPAGETGEGMSCAIFVFGSTVMPWPWWAPLAKQFGWRYPYMNWRGRGVGTMLLNAAIAQARAAGASFLVGDVMVNGIKEQPWLLEWYQRRGFTIEEPPPGGMYFTAAVIRMRF